MADPKTYELDELTIRPGTYFNPQTDIVLIVDDSPDVDTEIFNMEDFEGADWVLISDEVPIDGDARDELMQSFQVRHGATLGAGLDAGDDIVDEDENAEPEADELDDIE